MENVNFIPVDDGDGVREAKRDELKWSKGDDEPSSSTLVSLDELVDRGEVLLKEKAEFHFE